MPNVTISLNEKLLKAGRQYAEKHQTSLNALIRRLLEQTVQTESGDWIDDCFGKMDSLKVDSKGCRWSREELYDR
jgi:hypothetical protein